MATVAGQPHSFGGRRPEAMQPSVPSPLSQHVPQHALLHFLTGTDSLSDEHGNFLPTCPLHCMPGEFCVCTWYLLVTYEPRAPIGDLALRKGRDDDHFRAHAGRWPCRPHLPWQPTLR